MSKLRRFFTSALMVMVVLGMSAFVAPEAGAAAQAGDLIKMDGLSSVYYLGADGKRYVFPNQSTYFSWYEDFSGVVTISATELQSYPLGSNVTIRPGTYLVKITTDPKVYAVEPGGHLRWIQSEADAIELYGEDWATRVVDVPDSFFTNYTITDPLESGEYPAGSLISGSPIYYWDGEEFRWFASEAAFVANGFNFDFVVENPDLEKTPRGEDITGQEDFSKIDHHVDPTTPPVTGSGLTVALSGDTPISQSVPETASRIKFTTVNFTASHDGSVTLKEVTVRRTGLTGNDSGIDLWLQKDGVDLTSKRRLTNNEAVLTLSPNLTIPAGQTYSIDIVAELNGVTGNAAFGIAGAAHVDASGATVTGSFPVTGNLMSFTAYTVTTLEFHGDDDMTGNKVSIGDTDVNLGEFELKFEGTNDRDLIIESITLRNTGVEDLDKVTYGLHLEHAGEKVSEYATFDGRYVTFHFDGGLEMLEEDNDKSFTLRADIIDKESEDTNSINLSLHRDHHVVAYEKDTNFGVINDTQQVNVWAAEIESGIITVSKKSASPSNTNVVAGSNDVTVLLANIRADEAITADGLNVNYKGHQASFRNIRVYLNGTRLETFDIETNNTEKTEEIDTFIELNKGDNELKITVDVRSGATNNDTFEADVKGSNIFTGQTPEYVSSGILVDSDVISGVAEGAKLTVREGEVLLNRNDGFSDNRVIIEGSTNVLLGEFNLRARNDDMRITSIELSHEDETAGTSTPPASIYDMKLYVDGTQVGTTRPFGSSGSVFSGLNYTIAQDTSKTFQLRGSFDSSAADIATTTFQTKFKVNAQDSSNTSVGSTPSDVASALFLVKKSGDLTIEISPNTPSSDILISNPGVEYELARYRISSIDDSSTITEIKMNSIETATNASARISEMRLYRGSELIAIDVPTGNDVATEFIISDEKLKVAANSNETISVRAVFNDITLATESGFKYKMRITEVEAESSTGQSIAGFDSLSIAANEMHLRKTKPTFALINGVKGDTDTEQEMLRFSVTADSNADLRLNQLIFDLEGNASGTTEINGNDLKLYEVGETDPIASVTASGGKATFGSFGVKAERTITVNSAGTGAAATTTLTVPTLTGTEDIVIAHTTDNEDALADLIEAAFVDNDYWTASATSSVVTIEAKYVGDWANNNHDISHYGDGAPIIELSSLTGGVNVFSTEIEAGSSKTYYVVADTSNMGEDYRFGVSLRTSGANNNVRWQERFVAGYQLNADNSVTPLNALYLKTFPISGGLMTY